MATSTASPSLNGDDPLPTLSDIQHLWSRYEGIGNTDQAKNVLIEDLLRRYDQLVRKHHRYIDDHQHGRENIPSTRDTAEYWKQQALHMQSILNQNPFVMALIDGDSLLFHHNFLTQGLIGGQQAATLLHNAIIDRVLCAVPECPADVKIIVRVFVDLRSLQDQYVKAGLAVTPALLSEFARGFNHAEPLFDFIDVGVGKDLAALKVMEDFRLYIADFHCRQVVLGCDVGKSYSQLLDKYMNDGSTGPRLTVIEAGTAAKRAANYQMVSFPGVFRESRLQPPGQGDAIRDRVDSRVGLHGGTGGFTPSRSGTPGSTNSPLNSLASLNLNGNGGHGLASAPGAPNKAVTWAAITTKNAHKPLISESPKPAPSTEPKEILRNKQGQRLDRHLDYDREEVLRIKKYKSCNQHFIGVGCCHYNAGKEDKCPHNHHVNFTPLDLKHLRVVARETPCRTGHGCDNPKCIYGHQCPFPAATEGSTRGSGCINGVTCRFPRSMHDMDTVPAKMTKVVGTF